MRKDNLPVRIAFPCVLAGLAVLVYFPVFSAEAVWDDDAVFINPIVQDSTGIIDAWLHPLSNAYEEHYWPVTYSFFWMTRHIIGNEALGYHLANLILHVLNAILLYLLLRPHLRAASFIAPIIYVLHPLNVESVAWIMEAKNTLNLFFLLVAAIVWDRKGAHPASLALIPILFHLSTLSKATTLPLPFVLLALAWFGNKMRNQKVAPTTLIILGICAVTAIAIAAIDLTLVQMARGRASDFSHELPLVERTLLALRSIPFYFGKLMWPSSLYVLYPLWNTKSSTAFFLAVAVLTGIVLLVMRGGRPVLYIILAITMLAPASGIINFSFMRLSHTADRFFYVPGLISVVGFSELLTRIHSKTKVQGLSIAFIALSAVAMGIVTMHYVKAYKNSESLFSRTVNFNDESWGGHYNLANELAVRGELEQSIEHYRRAADINPSQSSIYLNWGNSLAKLRRYEKAISKYESAIALNPADPLAFTNAIKCAELANLPAKVMELKTHRSMIESPGTP